MKSEYDKALEAVDSIKSQTPYSPRLAIVLGSGLGGFVEYLTEAVRIPYKEIPHFPISTVPGHEGALYIGKIDAYPVIVMRGRTHFYEGYSVKQVVFPSRVMGLMGIQAIIITNAAGGINPNFCPGDLMLITDHLNLMGQNPLIGEVDEQFGHRFIDMSEAYDKRFIEIAKKVGSQLNILLREGVYAGLIGPSYETPAEINMLKLFGADAVGMSTIPGVISCRQMNIRVLAISCISNLAAGISKTKLCHAEVQETAERIKGHFSNLIQQIVKSIFIEALNEEETH